MSFRKSYVLPLLLSGFFFCLDQGLKYIAHSQQAFSWYIVKPWLGWEYFANPGIAFSVPFPNAALVIGTPLVLVGLLVYMGRHKSPSTLQVYGAMLIFLGAISNLIDRMLFQITIDYIRVITSVMNIADIMIIVGTLFIIFGNRSQKALDLDKSPDITYTADT